MEDPNWRAASFGIPELQGGRIFGDFFLDREVKETGLWHTTGPAHGYESLEHSACPWCLLTSVFSCANSW